MIKKLNAEQWHVATQPRDSDEPKVIQVESGFRMGLLTAKIVTVNDDGDEAQITMSARDMDRIARWWIAERGDEVALSN